MKVYELNAQYLVTLWKTYYVNARNKEQAKKKFLDAYTNNHETKECVSILINTYKQECGADPRESVSRTKKLIRTLEKNPRYALSFCMMYDMTEEV